MTAVQTEGERTGDSGAPLDAELNVHLDPQADADLQRHYEAAGRWSELVELLLSRAETAEPSASVVHLRRAAQVFEQRLDDPARAFATLEVAFRRDVRCLDVVAELERLAARLDRWNALIELADAVMLEVDEPALIADLWARVARWARRLGRWELAVSAGENALALAPAHEGGFLELEESYRHLGHFGPLARLLSGRARRLSRTRGDDGRGELLDLYLDLAAIYEERLGDDERAIAACKKALALDELNVAALARLERLAEKRDRPLVLADVLKRKLQAATSEAEKLVLARRLAQVWEAVGRVDAAITILRPYQEGGDAVMLRALARLHRAANDPAGEVQVLGKLLHGTQSIPERTALAREIARLLREQLGRAEEAEAFLLDAFTHEPSDVDTARALATSWRRRGEWARLADLLWRAGRHAPVPVDRVNLLLEAARVFRDQLSNARTAAEILSQVQVIAPDNQECAELLLEDALARNDWAAVRAALAPLFAGSEAAEKAPVEKRAHWHTWMARAGEATGDRQLALEHRRAAVALLPTHRGHVRALASLLYAEGHLADAVGPIEWLLSHPDPRENDEARGELAYRLARARLARKDRRGARRALEHAVALAPHAIGALEALGDLALEDGDPAAAVQWKERLFRRTTDPQRCAALAAEVAHLHLHHLQDPERAEQILRDGLKVAPGSHRILHALLDMFTEGRAWSRAYDVLITMADGARGRWRAKYLATAAGIAYRELGRVDDATTLYNQALDASPADLDIFARLDRLLTERRAFRAQAHAYRMMLARVRAQGDARLESAEVALLRGLGEIYRTRLGDYRAAVGAFEAAAALDGDLESRLILTELYELCGPETWGRALADRCRLIARAPNADEIVSHLRAVDRMSRRIGDTDRAWRSCEALVALGVASPDERTFHARHTAPLRVPGIALTEAGWGKLAHADQDPRLSLFFSALGRAMLVARSRPPESWGLAHPTAAERRDIERSILARLTSQLATVLRVPRPHMRFRPDLPGTVDMAALRGQSHIVPTFVAGGDMLQVRSKREIVALVGKKLTLMRWENLVLWPTVVPTAIELQVAVAAVRQLFGHKSQGFEGADARIVGRYARFLKSTLTAPELERIGLVAGELDPADVPRWVRGAFHTAGRIGLLMGGDLAVCMRLAAPEAVGAVTLTPFAQVRDLVAWSLSEEHALLRRELGLPVMQESLDDEDTVARRPRQA